LGGPGEGSGEGVNLLLRIFTAIFITIFSPAMIILLDISGMATKVKDLLLNAWIFTANYWLIYIQVLWVEKLFKKYYSE
jgi:hypothetical protein